MDNVCITAVCVLFLVMCFPGGQGRLYYERIGESCRDKEILFLLVVAYIYTWKM